MTSLHRTCHHHPDRRALGVCVITNQAICAECSTRYEGVNYSKEGLAILQARRAAETKTGGWGGRLAATAALLTSPLMLYLLYLFFLWSFETLIDLQQLEPFQSDWR